MEALRRHYALTLRAWVERLEKHWDAAVDAHGRGPGARVAALHGRVPRCRFEAGKLGVDQVLARRPGGEPPPLRRDAWI